MRKAFSSVAAVFAVAAVLVLQLALASPAAAQSRGVSMIRDAEIEHTIRTYAAPLLTAAGMDPRDVAIHLLSGAELNAFVARGQQIFVSTGLLMRAEHPGQVIGVLAHEIGHITGGHLARLEGAISDAQTQAMIGSIIGVALGVLTGQGGAAAAGTAKAQDIALRNLLKFTRTQERSADQVAVDLLDKSNQSSRGLLEFFEILQDQELLVRSRQDPYVITHPLTEDRIAFVRNHVQKSRFSNAAAPSELMVEHERMVAKLRGYINPPPQTLKEYKANDNSVPARYARAVAYYRDARLDEALPIIDGLLQDAPDDAYFHELRGQMLFESGRLADALPAYETAVRLRPDEPLLRVGLAHVQIELNRPELTKAALGHVEEALRDEQRMPLAWRLAAVAYGRDDQLGMSALALAEYNLMTGNHQDAVGQARKAIRLLKEGSPGWLRAQDLADTAERQYRRSREN
ncbi:MAG: M48 family metalloprotease [Rhodospirillaceae bacterium]